jgi:hypothetical protein
MNIRVRAAGRTAGFFAVATLIILAVAGLVRLNAELFIIMVALAAVVAWMIWVVYSIILDHLESEEHGRELVRRVEPTLYEAIDKEQ